MTDGPYTKGESVQVRIGARWRNGTVRGFLATALADPAVEVEVGEGDKVLLYEVFSSSPNLRKHPGHKSDWKPSTKYKGRQRVRYQRVIK